MLDVLPFPDLTQRIKQQEAELEKLRQELATRQNQWNALTQRKQELLEAIEKLDKEIHAVSDVTIAERTPAAPAHPPKPAAAERGAARIAKSGEKVSFPEFLVNLVRQAESPITIKELTETVKRHKYPTSSKNIRGMVKSRIYELVGQGRLQRAGDQPGFVLAKGAAATQSERAKTSAGPKRDDQIHAPAKPVKSAKAGPARKKESLEAALTRVLAKSTQPLTAKEMSTRLLASGFQTKSKDLTSVIWVVIGKMKNIQRVQGQGYRLRKTKTAAK